MIFQRAIDTFSLNPKQLFLIDGFGAILSAFLLGFVLVKLERVFGIPRTTLYFLALLPCFFAAFDFYCYRWIKTDMGTFLKAIAYINLLYCGLSMGLAIYHHSKITYWGWAYILLEILIVAYLAILELKTANQLHTVK